MTTVYHHLPSPLPSIDSTTPVHTHEQTDTINELSRANPACVPAELQIKVRNLKYVLKSYISPTILPTYLPTYLPACLPAYPPTYRHIQSVLLDVCVPVYVSFCVCVCVCVGTQRGEGERAH